MSSHPSAADQLAGMFSPLVLELLERLVDERVEARLAERDNGRRGGDGRRFVTVQEAAVALGLTERAVRAQVARGRLPARHLGTRILVDMDALSGSQARG